MKPSLIDNMEEITHGGRSPGYSTLGNVRSILSSIVALIVLIFIIVLVVSIYNSSGSSEGFTLPKPSQSFPAPVGIQDIDDVTRK